MRDLQNQFLLLLMTLFLIMMMACEKEDPIQPATISTISVTNISENSAQCGGNITSDGGGEISSRGIVWSTFSNPTVEENNGISREGRGTGQFQSDITDLQFNTTYYVRAYATNQAGMVYGDEKQFSTEGREPFVTTDSVTDIASNSAVSGGNITDDAGSDITARGVIYSTSENPTIEINEGITTNGTGTGEFTSSLAGLNAGTTYYVRAYATNISGTGYGLQESFTTKQDDNNTDWPRDSETKVVEVTNPETGQTWMDRNLGASRAATSSTDSEAYGDLYQWGRAADGHQIRTSGTTATKATTAVPNDGNSWDGLFITEGYSPYYWLTPQDDNLWQGVSGPNNPCPSGYRLPTEAEWEAERVSWSSNNAAGAFASPLKLPVAGGRSTYNVGLLYNWGSRGYYWASSTVGGTFSRYLNFNSSNAYMGSYYRGEGYSVRCLKD